MELGDRIRELRKSKSATLKDVGDDTKLSVSYLSDVERGRTLPSLETLEGLAAYFEISLMDMLEGVDIAGEKSERSMPPGLPDLLKDKQWKNEITDDWVNLLTKIELRGQRPRTKREWLELYLSLKRILDAPH